MVITLDGVEHKVENPSDNLLAQVQNLEFVMNAIIQKNNELQIAETAKIGYSRALKRELASSKRDE